MELWVEKYRPKKFEEVVGQEKVVKGVKSLINNLPHLLFYGPAGVGKTSLAYVIANEIFGRNIKANFLELNASDERGIEVIRDKVKGFAKSKGLGSKFKLIFLDEADALTRDAQQCLRRVMEQYHNSCRFIFSVNYVEKIIEPIRSRCCEFKFDKIEEKFIVNLLVSICKKEGVEFEKEAIDEIVRLSRGDLRKAINLLQSYSGSGSLRKENVRRGRVNKVKEIFKCLKEGRFLQARLYLQDMVDEGWDERQILVVMRDFVIDSDMFDVLEKGKILYWLMECDKNLILGINKLLAFDGLLNKLCNWRS